MEGQYATVCIFMHFQEGGTERNSEHPESKATKQVCLKREPVPGWKKKSRTGYPESGHCVPPSLTAVSGYHSEVHSLSA